MADQNQTVTTTTADVTEQVLVLGDAEHHHDDHGHSYGPVLGRYIEHPPEPPHLLQIFYKNEQKKLIKEYTAANPGEKAPKVVEKWLEKDANGNWVEVEGQSPTALQVLHAGTLKEKLPLVGYAPWENHAYFGLSLVLLIAFFLTVTAPIRSDRRKAMKSPGRLQSLGELITGAFDDFCKGVLGEENGRKYMPFIATLFMVVLVNNLMGLIPLMRASTASPIITFGLALSTFIVVQGTAWLRLGPVSYIYHLMGQPKDAIGWALSPLFLLLECISDFFAKPLSLTLRLMGNILGKDVLLGAFLGMGIGIVGLLSAPLAEYIGLPITVPFYFLGLLLSTIQALVFALLTMIYISMVLPHDHDHDHEHDHAHGHGHDEKGTVHEPLPA